MKKQIANCLVKHEYHMLSGTFDLMAAGYKDEDGIRKAVCFLNLKDGTPLYKEQYMQLRADLFSILQEKEELPVHLLMLFYTDYVDVAKRLAEKDYFWILDAKQERLMVYEPDEINIEAEGCFDELIAPLEQCLETIAPKQLSKKEFKFNNRFFVTYALIAINILVFFVLEQGVFRNRFEVLLEWGANYAPAVREGKQYYRLFSSMFLHADIEHLFNNMLLLCYIGRLLEGQLGKIRYFFVYFLSGMIAGLFSIGYNTHIGEEPFCIGASGAVFGLTGAMAVFVLWKQGRMAQISRRQMIIMVILSLYGGFTENNVDNAAHIGGLLAGAAAAVVLTLIHSRKRNKK